jgi:YD repeat-containing protein
MPRKEHESWELKNEPLTTTYPDGEVVTTSYNRQGLPQGLTGLDDYVLGTLYNARGQTTSLVLGNGRTTSYSYDPFLSGWTAW